MSSPASRRRALSRRARRGTPAADRRHHQRLPRAPRRARRLSRDLPLGRRRRGRLAGPAGSRHQHARRRADRRAPHHRRVRAAAAGGRGHGVRRERVQRRAHGEVAHQVRRRRACTSRTRSARSAAATGPTRSSCRSRRWWTGSSPRPTRRPIRTSWSWRAPTRSRWRGCEAAVERACACVEAGADMIFPEAITDLAMYRKFADAVKVPILANITEFGKTPLFTREGARERQRRDGALSALRVPRDERGGAARLRGASGATAARRACVELMQTPRRSLRLSRLPRLRAEARRAVRPRKGKVRQAQPRLGRASGDRQLLQKFPARQSWQCRDCRVSI